LEILKVEGNLPEENEELMRVDIGPEISALSSLRIWTGTLLGPVAFESEKELITLEISSGVV
jgi:hypothetical protein